MTSTSYPMARPPSEQLVDLHVYLVPKDAWNEKYRSAYNDVIHHTISAGFLRVWPDLSLYYLRNQILDQLGNEVVPTDYVFLKSVGRCLTQVKSKQEFELKVKNFIPPQVSLPEIFVLEAQRDAMNLASFTNHERMDLNGEEFSLHKEELAGNDMETGESQQQDQPPQTESRQKPTKIPRKINPVGTQATRQTGRQATGQIGKVIGSRLGKRPALKQSGAGGARSDQKPVTRTAEGSSRIARPTGATGRINHQQATKAKNIAGARLPRSIPGGKTAQNRTGQAIKPSKDGRVISVGGVLQRETRLGGRHQDVVISDSQASQERRQILQSGQARQATKAELRNRAGINRFSQQLKGVLKLPISALHVRQRDIGVQHATDRDTGQPIVHSNHLPDISRDTMIPLSSQSPRPIRHGHQHHGQSSQATHHQHHITNADHHHPTADHLHNPNLETDTRTSSNTPSSRLPLLLTHRGSQTNPMPDLITGDSRISSVSLSNQSSPTKTNPPINPTAPDSSRSPQQKRLAFVSPQKSPPSPSSHSHHPRLAALPVHLFQTSDPDSSPNSSANNSAGSSGRISTIVLPPEPHNPGKPVTNPHSNQQVDINSVSSSVNANHCLPSIDVSPSLANSTTNHQERPSPAHWAVPQTHRSSACNNDNNHHHKHQSSTCDPTPVPSQTPNVTPGGIPPLQLQHLETSKEEDPSTPIKSGRLDTYTNNTNEDSGVAELTPERTQLEYERQPSDSSERKQGVEKHQTPRALSLDSRERPDSISHSLPSTARPQTNKVPPSPEEAKRSRQKVDRERQRAENERRIEDEARREQEEKQRLLESEHQRETERWENEKKKEEERQRLLKARQNEIDKRRQEVAAAQKAKAAAAAAAQEAAHQQRLQDEEEEREMEEEIRKRQADELRQSRQMSWDQARQREETDQFTTQSHRDVRSQQKDKYNGSASDSFRRERTGDSLDQRRTKEPPSTKQSERPQDDLASFAEETGNGAAADDRSLGSAGASPSNSSGTTRGKIEAERERLLAELKVKQDLRFDMERTREELMRQAKTLQSRTVDRRNKDDEELESGTMTLTARDFWKKKYFEEKKKTSPLEETVNKLRGQVDQQHRKLLNQLEGRGPNRKGVPREPPSKKNDHKILIFKLRHQMEDLRRRVENSKMKLTSEIKLRNQAETELRGLRTEVLQRKIHVTVSRTQQLNTPQELPEDKLKGLTMQGTGATSYTPRGNLKAGLK